MRQLHISTAAILSSDIPTEDGSKIVLVADIGAAHTDLSEEDLEEKHAEATRYYDDVMRDIYANLVVCC